MRPEGIAGNMARAAKTMLRMVGVGIAALTNIAPAIHRVQGELIEGRRCKT
jgi:hypothetical protein